MSMRAHTQACVRMQEACTHTHTHTPKNPNPRKQEHKQGKTLKRQIQQPNMLLNIETTKPQAKQTYLNTNKAKKQD